MSKKQDMDVIQAVRLISLWHASRSSDKQEPDYVYRVMARWFSEKYNYKLHEVDDLPVEYVAQHYYEAQYEEMTPEDREAETKRLTQTEEEFKEAAAADDEFLKQAVKEAENAAKLRAATSALKEATKELKEVSIPKSKVKEIKKELHQPEIEMKFVTPEEMEEMGEWDVLGPPSSKKK